MLSFLSGLRLLKGSYVLGFLVWECMKFSLEEGAEVDLRAKMRSMLCEIAGGIDCGVLATEKAIHSKNRAR